MTGIFIGDLERTLELMNGLRESRRRRRGHDDARPCGYGEELPQYPAAGPQDCSPVSRPLNRVRAAAWKGAPGKLAYTKTFVSTKTALPVVGPIDVFAAERHFGISQSAF